MSIIALGLIGCGTTSTSTRTEAVPAEQAGGGTTTINAGGDVIINDTIVTDDGTYIYNPGSGDVTYVGGDYYYYADEGTYTEGNGSGGGASVAGMSEKTCKDNGFFWCTLSSVCIDNGGAGGTGSCSKSGS